MPVSLKRILRQVRGRVIANGYMLSVSLFRGSICLACNLLIVRIENLKPVHIECVRSLISLVNLCLYPDS